MKFKTTVPYGEWQSPVSIEDIFSQPAAPSYPFRWQNNLFWLQSLPEEGGRIALMQCEDADPTSVKCLTPENFNIRSRVHEYGGCCFCVQGENIVFNNFADGRVYRQSLVSGDKPVAITPEDDSCIGFADIKALSGESQLIAVIERVAENAENQNALVIIDQNHPTDSVYDIAAGCDFYACPSVSPQGDRLVWFEWNHPGMPWDKTRIGQCRLIANEQDKNERVSCSGKKIVLDEPNCAVNQLGYLADGSLVYARDGDHDDWSNLYRRKNGQETRLTNMEAEFGQAHWVFGQCRWLQVDDNSIYAIATAHAGDALYQIDIEAPDNIELVLSDANISHLSFTKGKIQCVVGPENRNASVVEIDPKDNSFKHIKTCETDIQNKDCSSPIAFSCATRDGEKTYGYLYRPHNPLFSAPKNTRPPLIVMVHGGPTSRTDKSYHSLKQYFSSVGFAVLDINHRGSTGYGRAYRQRLLGSWGEADALDIADAIEHLVNEGEIDKNHVFIRGGSAGGYAVLRALTEYPEMFAGGACYYGIGNLITLSEITHKFESRYTDMLIGEPYSREDAKLSTSRYRTRSPIFHMDKLTAPIILFQGLLDKVVPPEVTKEVVQLLESRDIHHEYHGDEGHGFRNAANRVDSLERETRFFIDILKEPLQKS